MTCPLPRRPSCQPTRLRPRPCSRCWWKRSVAGLPALPRRQELLYPSSVRRLKTTLISLADLREVYHFVLGDRPPESDDDFGRWMIEDKDARQLSASPPPAEPGESDRPDVRAAACCHAEHFVLMARAEALDDLGEREEGIRLVQEWMRSQKSRGG